MTSVLDRPKARSAPRRERGGGPARAPAPARTRRIASEQLAVAGGQLGAGLGNLLFATIAARALAPGQFAQLAAFLALYLLIHVPAGSLSAGSALQPALAAAARRRVLRLGATAGGMLALLAFPLSGLLNVSPALLIAAAASAPTAGLLALDRGRLYGLPRLPRAVGSLLAEPLVRLTIGLALALVAGPVGAAVGVVLAGWAALAVAQLPAADRRAAAPRRDAAAPTAGVIGAFLALAIVQNQDVLLANAVLPEGEAARFAVLSTVGGAAAFATTTVPLMLLGRAGDRHALRIALAVAGALGLAAVLVVALDPHGLVALVFGDRYGSVGTYAVPYLLAMALLGVGRVLVAHASARGGPVLAALAGAVALQALLLARADTVAGVVTATVVGAVTLTAGAGVLALPRPPTFADVAALARRQDVTAVAALTLAGLVIRLVSSRGIWLDEATSVWQAQLSLPDMLHQLKTIDVHPPLHHLVLWVTVRIAGTSELAVRLPSMLAATALIPLLYAAGRDIYDRRAGLVAAALGTVAPFAVWYAQEARMYALFMVFALLAVWMQVRILRGGSHGAWIGYTLSAAALVATQYFGLLLVVVQQVAFLAIIASRRDRAMLRSWLLAGAALTLLLAPVLAFGHAQFAANEAAGKGFQQVPSQTGGNVTGAGAAPGPYAVLTNVVWAVLGYHDDTTMTSLAAMWPLLLLLVLALLGRGRSSRTLLLVAAAGVPAVALFALGQLKPFVFEVRYFIGAVPLVLLLIARAATSWSPRRVTQVVVGVLATALLAVGLADQQLNGDNPRVYDFRGALRDTAERARPGDALVYTPFYLDHVVDYYAADVPARPLGDGVPKIRRGQRVFVLASFLDKPQYRDEARKAVRQLARRFDLVAEHRYPQIRVWEFER